MSDVSRNRPYFLWDYDLTEDDVRRILARDNETEKIWMMSRIVGHASYDDVWKYIPYTELKEWFPKLRLRPQMRRVWEYALSVWEGTSYGTA
ncbi:MAG: hypothetical protein AAB492_05510 [Patescibacteria group bacterium]